MAHDSDNYWVLQSEALERLQTRLTFLAGMAAGMVTAVIVVLIAWAVGR